VPLPLSWCNAHDDVELFLPPKLVADAVATRPLRARALRELGFVDGESFFLSGDPGMNSASRSGGSGTGLPSYEPDAGDGEDDEESGLARLRLMCSLLVADDATLSAHLEGRGELVPPSGAGPGESVSRSREADCDSILCIILDHNLSLLPTCSSVEDAMRVEALGSGAGAHAVEAVALYARIRHRDLLVKWRERFASALLVGR
jgi:hypothetical protein